MIPFFFLLIFGIFQPQHFGAYEVSAAGKNIIVDPESARYTPCKVEVLFKDNRLWFGGQSYQISGKSRLLGDSVTTFFCYRLNRQDSIFLSMTTVPAKERNHWLLLFAWQDSTKAFKAVGM
jgi:hypothetical protein